MQNVFRWPHMVDEVINVITKPTQDRSDADIQSIDSWLRKRSNVLHKLDADVLRDILKNCEHRNTGKDDVLVRQGERGDSSIEECFYIILNGTVSVYVDLKFLSEEDGELSPIKQMNTPEPQHKPACGSDSQEKGPDLLKVHTSHSLAQTPTEEDKSPYEPKSVIAKWKSMERSKFGKFLIKFDQGMSFGEMALINRDSSRNATIVTDGECDFLVIRQELFERTLKILQEKEFADKAKFIENHPFFCHMTPKLKKVLELSLRKETISYETSIVKQGEPVDGLYFIFSGQAKVIVTPGKHRKQYPHLWPFEAAVDLYSVEFEWLREARRNAILRKYQDPAVLPTKSEDVLIRRNAGYAEIEKKNNQKQVGLCSVQNGEAIGDTEILLGLGTHMQTVRCTSNTDIFFLHSKNFERLVGRKNTTTVNVVRQHVLSKLKTRFEMKQGNLIPLLQYLYFKITEQALPEEKTLPPLKMSKSLPGREIESLHLLKMYKEGKSPLINPLVPGGLYYKELMLEKAKERKMARNSQGEPTETFHKATRRGRPQRNPRSLLEIRETLRQMMEAELIAVESEKIKDNLSSRGTSMASVITQSDKMASNSSIVDQKQFPSIQSKTEVVELDKDEHSGIKSKNKSVFITQTGKSEKPLPPIQEEKTNEELQLKKGREAKLDGKSILTNKSARESETFTEFLEQEQKRSDELKQAEMLAQQKIENDVFKKFQGSILFEQEDVPTVYTTSSKSVSDEHSSQINVPAVGEISDLLGEEFQLKTLEDRIRSFHIKYCGQTKMHLKLPKLRRYKVAAEEMKIPKPGGKVWIRKRMCKFADKKVQVKDHEHVRYQIVPSLPDFEEIQSSRILEQPVTHGHFQHP